jgi:hypothetical protein
MVELTCDIAIIICKNTEEYGLDYLKTIGKSWNNGAFNYFCCVFWHITSQTNTSKFIILPSMSSTDNDAPN